MNNLKSSAFLFMLVLILSCSHNPKIEEVKKISDSKPVAPYNTNTDDLVAFISGMASDKSECFSKIDSITKWISYARELDSIFSYGNSIRFEKMKIWADSELIKIQGITTVFYPFSGPDFLNTNIFYPDAEQYIMIGMEPIGYLPDICDMPPDSVRSYLNSVNNALKDSFKRSYFITSKMDKDLRKTKVNGTVPLISLFIKRTDHQIVSIQRIGVDAEGKLQIIDSFDNIKNIVPGIKIDFIAPSKKKVQSVLYFRTDISDKGLEKHKGFKKYLSGFPSTYTYLKAASYLMHSNNFKIIRSEILNISATILQDDSGIAYKYFDKSKWDIKLYGKYYKPKGEFSYIKEPDLEEAYKHSVSRPLQYTLGYNWRADHSNMLYAIKK
jgi:hypothetical protein